MHRDTGSSINDLTLCNDLCRHKHISYIFDMQFHCNSMRHSRESLPSSIETVRMCVCVSLIAPHATEFNDRATHHAKSRTVWEHDIRNMWYCPWRFQFATVLADSGFWLNVAVTVTVAAATTNHNIFRCGIDHKSERTLAAVELCTHSPSIYIYIYFF